MKKIRNYYLDHKYQDYIIINIKGFQLQNYQITYFKKMNKKFKALID